MLKQGTIRFLSAGRRMTLFLAVLLAFGLSSPAAAAEATAREIDLSVEVALERFYEQVRGAREFARSAKGMLVMPNVKKAALFVGGEYGEGALLVDGLTLGYYNIISGSFGLSVGAQSKDLIIAFMTAEAVSAFRNSNGWEAGVDGNIALLDVGAGERIDTTTIKSPIVAFVFDVKGLMADVSLKGAKFNQLNLQK